MLAQRHHSHTPRAWHFEVKERELAEARELLRSWLAGLDAGEP
jgi:hypothetical protein